MGQCLNGESDYDYSKVVYKYQPYDWFGESSKEKEKPKETVNSGISLNISAKPNIDNNTIVFTASSTESNHLDSISISLTMGQCTSAQSRANGNSIEEEPYRVSKREPYTRYKSRYEPYSWDIYVDTEYAKDYSRARKDRSRSLNSLRWDFYVDPEQTQRKELLEIENEDKRPYFKPDTVKRDKSESDTSPKLVQGREKVKKPFVAKLEEPLTINTDDEDEDEKEETPRKLIAENTGQSSSSDYSDDEDTKERKLKTTSPPPRYSDVVTKTTSVMKYDNVPRSVDKKSTEDREPPEKQKSIHEPKKMDEDEYLDLHERESSPKSRKEVEKPSASSRENSSVKPLKRDVYNRESQDQDIEDKQPYIVKVSNDNPFFKAPETRKEQTKPSQLGNNIHPAKAPEVEKEPYIVKVSNDNPLFKAPEIRKEQTKPSQFGNNIHPAKAPEVQKEPYIVKVSNDNPLFKAPEIRKEQTKPSQLGNNIHPAKAPEVEKEQITANKSGEDVPVTRTPYTENDQTKPVKPYDKNRLRKDLETKDDPTKMVSLKESDRPIETDVPRRRNGSVKKEKPVITIETKTSPTQTTKAVISPRRNSDSDLGTRPEKTAIKQTVLIPSKFPQLFTGKRHAWRGLLLFGPAGSGKASLATAVAKEIGHSYCTLQTFMTLNSYSGNAVTAMFKKARENVPHVIIIDHLEGLSASETRELHKQMISSTEKEFEGLLVVGISDAPWILDKSVVELFEKRIFITLPSAASRAELFRENLEQTQHNLTEEDFIELGAWSEGYSCADIITVVNETLMQSVRKIQDATYFKKVTARDVVTNHNTDMFTPCSPGENGAIEMDWTQVPEKKLLEPSIRLCDVLVALRTQKPSLKPEDVEKHKQFARKFTQHGNNTVV